MNNKNNGYPMGLSVLSALVCMALAVCFTAVFFAACGQKTGKLNDTASIFDYMIENGSFPKLTEVDEDTAAEIYGIMTDKLTSFRFAISEDRLLADEAAVFELADEAYAADLIRVLESNIAAAARAAKNYSPEQYAILTKTVVSQKGRFVFYIVNEDSASLTAKVKAAISGD